MIFGLWLVVACTTTPEPRTHTVVKGDTLGVLAREHRVTVADLKAWNGLSSDRIDVGQVLILEGEPTTAAAPSRPRPTPRSPKPTPSEGLRRPAAKRCLDGPSEAGSSGMAASTGLSASQVSAAMNRFAPKLGRCLVDMPTPSGALPLRITVGCDGRVDDVRIEGTHGWSASHAACIAETLRFAEFPAHALPDGDTFGYPLTYNP